MERLISFSLNIIIWLATSSGVALAQTQPPDLIVTLHDVADAPLVGVTVIIRDAGAAQPLAQVTTNAHGTATFDHVMESQVRVVIVGSLPDGTRLFQPGNDAAGVSFLLSTLPATLTLRSAADGMVAPDPAAMAREIGVPVATAAAIPTAPIAPTVSITQVAAQAPTIRISTADVTSRDGNQSIWLGGVALLVLISAGVAIVMVQRRAQ